MPRQPRDTFLTFDALNNPDLTIPEPPAYLGVETPPSAETAPTDHPPAPVPCTFCGEDYIAALGARASNSVSNCTCDGCRINRARSAAMNNLTDTSVWMHAITLISDTGENRVIPACRECATRFLEDCRMSRQCASCGSTCASDTGGLHLDREPDDLSAERLHTASPFLATMQGGLRAVEMSRSGGLAQRRSLDPTEPHRRVRFRPGATMTLDGGTAGVCEECESIAAACDDCHDVGFSPQRCNPCDALICWNCFNRNHSHPRERDDFYEVRSRFRPRASIGDSLIRESVPGRTVRSTRAIGIEVETARGDLAAVIAAERNAAIPVLAACGTDASVNGANAVEFRLLPQRGVWVEYAIRSVAAWAREANYVPDTSAGIHMHVDCRDLRDEWGVSTRGWRAYAALAILENVFYAHAAPHRRNGQYCRASADLNALVEDVINREVRGDTFDPFATAMERYYAINPHAWNNHETLEVRAFDTAHDAESVIRLTDAAAIIAGAVDWSLTADYYAFTTAWRGQWGAERAAVALLTNLANADHISTDTLTRALTRFNAETIAGGTGYLARFAA